MKTLLRIGTRGSALALAQATLMRNQIQEHHPQVTVELTIIKTTGDKIQDVPLAKIGGKGLFTKEIELAIAAGEVDLGVHSMKDVPTEVPPGLVIGITTRREDPRDAFISRKYPSIMAIPAGGRIGTGSLRRRAQLLHLRPDLEIIPLRGNVDTRLRKLVAENLDGLILATAGLRRLGRAEEITAIISDVEMLPAIGQGALGLEYREADRDTKNLLAFLDHPETKVAVAAERAFLRAPGGRLSGARRRQRPLKRRQVDPGRSYRRPHRGAPLSGADHRPPGGGHRPGPAVGGNAFKTGRGADSVGDLRAIFFLTPVRYAALIIFTC